MYTVVSRWDIKPGKYDEFEKAGRKMRAILKSWPEVSDARGIRIGPEAALAIVDYKSEADYQRLIQDPNGPFEKAAKEQNIENIGTWVWSERGEAMPND